MARLNDPPIAAPVESIDALKRRFIRQNREIARVNSTQSLRIRNLEAEISRLLAENIAIREQAINIAQESEKWRAAYKATTEITSLKDRLEAKLQEVNTLVIELGELPEKTARRKSGPRKSILNGNSARSPAEKDWRNRQTISGVLNAERAEQEGRLPAILEDKSYPRRTLDPSELQTPLDEAHNPLESPELGPPPVAHFEVPESLKSIPNTDPEKSPQPQRQPQPIVSLSVNLENRRKRRTSALLQDIPVGTEDAPQDDQPSLSRKSELKTGAKRKLDASILEDKNRTSEVLPDDFVWKKAERDLDSRGTRFVRPARGVPKDPASSLVSEDAAKTAPASRKILAPKSTNSPMKSRVRVSDKPMVQRIETDEELKVAKRVVRPDTVVKPTDQQWRQEDFDATLQGQLAPKTPYSEDILSPVSTEPPARKQEMAITNSVEDVLNGSIGRGSRRARAAVSYAEPNLRDKMRRPGKELVGAVEGIDKRTREGSIDDERSKLVEEPTPRVITNVKRERLDIPEDWKKIPHVKEEAPSPLRDKSSKSPEEGDGKKMKKQKKEVLKRRVSGKTLHGVSADYTHDYTIINDNQLEDAVRRLSIFDPPSSSPISSGRVSGGPYPETIDVDTEPQHLKRSKSTTAAERNARRHSASVATTNTSSLTHSRSISDISIRPSSRQSLAGSRPGSAASIGQRPNSAASMRVGDSKIGHDGARKTASGSSRNVSAAVALKEKDRLATSSGTVDVDADSAAAARGRRRRSMMT